jgi:hypothetical protein
MMANQSTALPIPASQTFLEPSVASEATAAPVTPPGRAMRPTIAMMHETPLAAARSDVAAYDPTSLKPPQGGLFPMLAPVRAPSVDIGSGSEYSDS